MDADDHVQLQFPLPPQLLLSQFAELVKEVSSLPDCNTSLTKKLYTNLVRRIKLLSPFFEELNESGALNFQEEELRAFGSLKVLLDSALQLLKSVQDGSKLYQALEKDRIAVKFHLITEDIEAALSDIHYDKLSIPEDVREQTELVHAQFKRAKGKMESPDIQLELDLDLAVAEKNPDTALLKRLAEKLQLRTINDLKKESYAFNEVLVEEIKGLKKKGAQV